MAVTEPENLATLLAETTKQIKNKNNLNDNINTIKKNINKYTIMRQIAKKAANEAENKETIRRYFS